MDRSGRRWQAPAALGIARNVGDVCLGTLQLRIHDRSQEGDHGAVHGGRNLHQPLGWLRYVLLRGVPEEFQRVEWLRTSTHEQNRRSRPARLRALAATTDRKSTRLNSSHLVISYAVFCLKKKTKTGYAAGAC